jgi:hypothetical protein
MTTAFDEFERALVKASRALGAQPAAGHAAPSQNGSVRRARGRRLWRGARHLSIAAQLGLAFSSISALAGGGVVSYLLLSDNSTRTLASFSCNLTPLSAVGVNAVTGAPLIDCAAAWASATAGRAAAPPLAVWGTSSGTESAVVQPASWGPPRGNAHTHWRRLPAGWTVNLGVVELTDQLSDISISPYGGPPCTYAGRDVRVVRSLFAADGLDSWQVSVSPSGPGAGVSAACRWTLANVDGGARTVELLQASAPNRRPVPLSAQQRRLAGEAAAADRRLVALHGRVNRVLGARCESVSAAAALWSADARAAGLRPTTLAFWRAVNARSGPQPSGYFDRYTLYRQPPSQHTGSCAHVLVMVVPGSGLANVYAARIAA